MAQESQNNHFSFKLIYKYNQIIRSLEIYKILFNKTCQLMMIYKYALWKLPTKITFFFYLIYFFNVLFCNRILSYFAKPNFIVYDEWFNNDFKKTKLDFKNKKITNRSKIHEFFMNYQITKLVHLKITCK